MKALRSIATTIGLPVLKSFPSFGVSGLILGSASFAVFMPSAYAVNTISLSGPEHIQASGTYHFIYTGNIADTISFFGLSLTTTLHLGRIC
jgi:ABC-type thiamin/hydroxymethylpyrimidine transport system permease subunit